MFVLAPELKSCKKKKRKSRYSPDDNLGGIKIEKMKNWCFMGHRIEAL